MEAERARRWEAACAAVGAADGAVGVTTGGRASGCGDPRAAAFAAYRAALTSLRAGDIATAKSRRIEVLAVERYNAKLLAASYRKMTSWPSTSASPASTAKS